MQEVEWHAEHEGVWEAQVGDAVVEVYQPNPFDSTADQWYWFIVTDPTGATGTANSFEEAKAAVLAAVALDL